MTEPDSYAVEFICMMREMRRTVRLMALVQVCMVFLLIVCTLRVFGIF
jgi:hypothetical protein